MVLLSFEEKVWNLVSKIPEGKVTTYGCIARAIGKPNAYRAVGNALANNPKPVDVPCHRVIRSNGEVGNYSSGGREEKKKLLKEEGVRINGEKIRLEEFLFDGF